MPSDPRKKVLVLHPDLGGGEHYPGMCHRWVGVAPFFISPHDDRFCFFLTSGLSFQRGGGVFCVEEGGGGVSGPTLLEPSSAIQKTPGVFEIMHPGRRAGGGGYHGGGFVRRRRG